MTTPRITPTATSRTTEGYTKDNIDDYTKLAHVRRAPQAASIVGFCHYFTSTSCQFLIDRF